MLVFHRSPEPLHKDIISPGALAIHTDPYLVVLEYLGKRITGILTSLIGVEYLGLTIAVFTLPRIYPAFDSVTPW